MFKLKNKGDMVQKDSSNDSETDSNSPDLRAFLDLVDRAHSLQLLNEKNQGFERPLRNNFSAWQPSFEPEDFNLPPKKDSISPSTVDCPRTRTATVYGGAVGAHEGKEDRRMKNCLKRPRHLVDDLVLHHIPEKGLKKGETSNKVLLCDLNKEVESSEAVNGGYCLNLELGIKKN